MFKWTCYGTGVLLAVVLLVVVHDLKSDVTASLDSARTTLSEANQAVTTINEKLPEIVSEVKKGTETLSELAEDVALIKSVAGIQNEQADRGLRGLATYADAIQRVLAEQAAEKEGVILIEEIIGSDLKQVETVEEFLVGLNKEMVTLILPLAKSKQEVLYRTCYSGPPRRKPFYIQFPNQKPVALMEFLKSHHAESAKLPPFEP